MASLRAHVVRALLDIFLGSRTRSSTKDLTEQRRIYDRNCRLLFPPLKQAQTKSEVIAGVPVVWVTVPESTNRTIVFLHGGGFVFGSPRASERIMAQLAIECKATVVGIDYPLAPEHPFPAAHTSILAVWQALLAKGLDSTNAVIAGDSAGANLAITTSLRLREMGLPQPACLVALSPALDATFALSGPSDKDSVLNRARIDFFADAYCQQHDKTDPFISPVYAKLNGLPPTLLHVAAEEAVYPYTLKLKDHAKRDGWDLTFYAPDDVWHVWHLFDRYVPEAREAMVSIGEYVLAHTPD